MKRTLSYILSFAFICSALVITGYEDRINENSNVSAEAAETSEITEAVKEAVTEVPKVTDTVEVTDVPAVTEPAAVTETTTVTETKKERQFDYKTSVAGKITLTNYIGKDKDVVIPSEIDGHPVTAIGAIFMNNKDVTSVVIPNSVTSIRMYAFRCCSNLTSVTLPSGLEEIDDETFRECTSLTSVVIPEGVKRIGWEAFSGCTELSSITFPDSVTDIGKKAFKDTKWYNEHPDGIVYAGKCIYRYKGTMPENTSLVIPDSVKGICDEAFAYCDGMVSVTLPQNLEKIDSAVFYGCSGLTEITIPSGVKQINVSTFAECTGLKEIRIPENVEYGCTGLTSVELPESLQFVNISLFENCTSLKSVTIPENYRDIASYAFKNCKSLTSVKIPESVNVIEDEAFSGCTGLTEIIIQGNPEMISSTAFSGCSSDLVMYGRKDAKIKYYGFEEDGHMFSRECTLEEFAAISGIKFADISTLQKSENSGASSGSSNTAGKVHNSPATGQKGIAGTIALCIFSGILSVVSRKRKCSQKIYN